MTNDAIYSALMAIKQDIGQLGQGVDDLRREIARDRDEHRAATAQIAVRVETAERHIRDLQVAPAAMVHGRVKRLWTFGHDLIIAGGSGTAVFVLSHWKF